MTEKLRIQLECRSKLGDAVVVPRLAEDARLGKRADVTLDGQKLAFLVVFY